MNPKQRSEYDCPKYGWAAMNANVERHISELADAVHAWETRNTEKPHASYVAASTICQISRALSADCAQLATLALMVERSAR